jgi:hypothetical protein
MHMMSTQFWQKKPGMTESHHFFIIFILIKTTKMQVRESTMVQNIEKW